MKKIVLLFSILIATTAIVTAQTTPPLPTPSAATDTGKVSKNLKHDTLRHHRKMIWATADTITSGDYMTSIERVNDKLNTIRDSVKMSLKVMSSGRRLDKITKDIAEIRERLGGRRARVNLRNLYLYQSFIENLDDDNQQLRQFLTTTYNRFYHAKLYLKTAMKDSIFIRLDKDTVMSKVFDKRLDRMQRKWMRTDSITRVGLNQLNELKLKVSDNSMNIANMLNMLDNRLDKADLQLFGPEAPCLWQFTVPDTVGLQLHKSASSISMMEQKALAYYFDKTSQRRIVMLLVALLLFGWWWVKRRQLKAFNDPKEHFTFLRLKYINTHPVLALLMVLLALIPFFDAYAPTLYLTGEYLISFIIASVIFFTQWDRKTWYAWIVLVVLFVLVSVSYVWVEPKLLQRYWLVLLQIGVIVFALRFYNRCNDKVSFRKWIRMSMYLSVLLAVSSILTNIFGRFSLAGIIGVTSIFTLMQAVILPICIDTILEVILLQIQLGRLRKGIKVPFDPTLVTGKLKLPMIAFALILWFIMLASNLNIYHGISEWVGDLLTSTRSIGSISFKLSSVLLFFLIIWVAHILQRLISFLFGETGNEAEDGMISKGQHSRLLMLRLFVLCGGYLLAVAASGLPIDKITIVLGALGVGIGMGLQNIVNNFVSGIILIFDGSLQIGDVIEVSGQSGKVKEIGLRASTLNTADGAEVIIPNGTILSQNIVNWTYSNDQRRVMIEIALTGDELDANVISTIINTTVNTVPHVIAKKQPVILFTQVQERSCRLTVRFWSTITNTDQVKSDALLKLKEAFLTKGIVMG
ncbi:MAG: mechanosensitive ion channel [Bacteroidetes bacterium]|nr:mechanosensitive ion channel [Bacteroidota bacterium]